MVKELELSSDSIEELVEGLLQVEEEKEVTEICYGQGSFGGKEEEEESGNFENLYSCESEIRSN